MEYFFLTDSRSGPDYNIINSTIGLWIPKVRNETCGHEWTISGGFPFPYDVLNISELKPLIKKVKKFESLSSSEWGEYRIILENVMKNSGRLPIPLHPGVRLGPLSLTYTSRGNSPDAIDMVWTWIYSERVLDHIRRFLNGVEVFSVSATRKKGKEKFIEKNYFELVPTVFAKFAPASELKLEVCPVCGACLHESYRGIIVDETGLDNIDIFRMDPVPMLYSERFKNAIEEIGVEGLLFIPSWRIGQGPGARSLTDLRDSMESERQTGQPPDDVDPRKST